MTTQPLLRWLKETAMRAPNAIEDLDQFYRNMGCVDLKAAVYPSGVVFMHNRYSCCEMGDIVSLFERKRIPAGDITPRQKRKNSDPHRKVSAHGRFKYDPDNLGKGYLWVPFEGYERWVELKCANPDMEGMPLFVHKRVLELAKAEADAFCSPEEQSYYRAILFNEIANVSAKSTKAQRKLLGRALAHSETAKSLRRYVEVAHEDDIFGFSDEDDQKVDNSADEADADDDEIYGRDLLPTVINNKLAGTDRKDSDQLIPRPRPKKHQQVKTWAESERAKNRGVPSSRRGQGQDHQIVRKQKPRRAGGMNIKWEAQR
ncbi:hypothetical protein QUA99_25215 [Microcoleus sp. F10-B2]